MTAAFIWRFSTSFEVMDPAVLATDKLRRSGLLVGYSNIMVVDVAVWVKKQSMP